MNVMNLKNKFKDGMYLGLGFALIIGILGVVTAAGFHYANEIIPGDFQDGNYSFNGTIKANDFIKSDGSSIGSSGVSSLFIAQTIPQTSYTVPVGGWYIIPFETEITDVDNVYNPTTYTFTAPSDGYYHLTLTVGFIQTGDTDADPLTVSIYCADSSQYYEAYSPGWYYSGNGFTYFMGTISVDIALQAGKSCKPQLYKQTGPLGRVGYGAGYTNFAGYKLQ